MLYRPDSQPSDDNSLNEQLRVLVKDSLRPLLTALLIFVVINFFFPRYFVEGQSMEPQLHDTDRLLASHLDLLTSRIERGEVVTLYSPRDGVLVVKRVIGLPKETIEVEAGTVYVNGVPLAEPYVNELPTYSGTWSLGENQYFVLGDNRNHSLDSHIYGPVNIENLQGVVRFRWWPLNALRGFSVPSYDSIR